MSEADYNNMIHALQRIAEALEEQNRMLQECILNPAEGPARLKVGICGTVEVIDL